MKAVVMAGGEGTRLRPMTANQPKPLLPVVNRPIMEHVLRLLRRHGFTDTVVTVQFLASLIRNYFGDGDELGMNLQYATEEKPLGTAGSVKNAEAELRDSRFVVISGDALTDIDLTDMARFHEANNALVTVALKRVPNPLEFGIVNTADDGRIERFPRKANVGPGVFRHREHRHLHDGAGDLQVRRRRRGRRLVARRLPAVARCRRAGLRLHRRRVLGGCRHAREPSPGAGRRAEPAGRCRHRRLRDDAGRVGLRGRRGRPRGDLERPALHRQLRKSRGRGRASRVHRARQQCRRQERRVLASRRGARQRLHRTAGQSAWLHHRQEHRHHASCPDRRRRRHRRRVRRRGRGLRLCGREGLPVQDHRSRRAGQHQRDLGVQRAAQPVRATRSVRARERRDHARTRRPARVCLCHDVEEGRRRHDLA